MIPRRGQWGDHRVSLRVCVLAVWWMMQGMALLPPGRRLKCEGCIPPPTCTHLKDRMLYGVLIGWFIDHVCFSCQFYDIWKWNPRKALRRVTESQIKKLNCKMTYVIHVWGSRLSPASLQQTDNQMTLFYLKQPRGRTGDHNLAGRYVKTASDVHITGKSKGLHWCQLHSIPWQPLLLWITFGR